MRDRERQSMSGGGAEREGKTQNAKQALGSELSAQILTRGLNSWTARSWPEPKADALTGWATQAPPRCSCLDQTVIWNAKVLVPHELGDNILRLRYCLTECSLCLKPEINRCYILPYSIAMVHRSGNRGSNSPYYNLISTERISAESLYSLTYCCFETLMAWKKKMSTRLWYNELETDYWPLWAPHASVKKGRRKGFLQLSIIIVPIPEGIWVSIIQWDVMSYNWNLGGDLLESFNTHSASSPKLSPSAGQDKPNKYSDSSGMRVLVTFPRKTHPAKVLAEEKDLGLMAVAAMLPKLLPLLLPPRYFLWRTQV